MPTANDASPQTRPIGGAPDARDALARAAMLFRAGDLDACEAILRDTVAADPREADAHNMLGFVYEASNRSAAAIAAFRRAMALRPDAPALHNNIAAVLARRGQLDEALAAYDSALRLDPTLPMIHFNRAAVLQRLGRGFEAILGYDRALALKPDFHDAAARMAALLARLDARVYRRSIDRALRRCFAAPQAEHAVLARTAARQIMLKHDILKYDPLKYDSLKYDPGQWAAAPG